MTLHTHTHKQITLTDAMAAFPKPLAGAYALYYAGNQYELKAATEPPLAGCYEARVFNAQYELRWVADDAAWNGNANLDTPGAAVLLHEGDAPINALPDWTSLAYPEVLANPSRYLLAERIAVAGIPGDSKALCTVEYFDSAGDPHGNLAVIAERLAGFKAYEEETLERVLP